MRILLFTKRVRSLTVRGYAQFDRDAEIDWMDAPTLALARSGAIVPYGTTVEIERNNHVIGSDSLWGTWANGDDDPYLVQTIREQVLPAAVEDARATFALD